MRAKISWHKWKSKMNTYRAIFRNLRKSCLEELNAVLRCRTISICQKGVGLGCLKLKKTGRQRKGKSKKVRNTEKRQISL